MFMQSINNWCYVKNSKSWTEIRLIFYAKITVGAIEHPVYESGRYIMNIFKHCCLVRKGCCLVKKGIGLGLGLGWTLTQTVTDIKTWSGNSAPSRYWMFFRNYVFCYGYLHLRWHYWSKTTCLMWTQYDYNVRACISLRVLYLRKDISIAS